MTVIDCTQYVPEIPVCQGFSPYVARLYGNSMDGAGFRGRLFLAWSLWQVRHQRKLSQSRLGAMVGEMGGEPVSQSTVSDWFRSVVPDVHDIEHLAKALEVDPGWLAFGDASTAQGPEDPSAPVPMPPPRGKPR